MTGKREKQIESSDDYEKVIENAEKEWNEYYQEHVWD